MFRRSYRMPLVPQQILMAPTKLTIKNTNLNQGQQHLLSIYSISVHSFTRGMVWKWNCETGDALSRVLLFWCCGASRSATGNVVDWHDRGGQNRRVNTRHLFSGSIVLHMKFILTSIGRIYYKNNHLGLSLPLPQTLYKRAHYAISDSIMLRQCKASSRDSPATPTGQAYAWVGDSSASRIKSSTFSTQRDIPVYIIKNIL